jgi:hypothetical protein
MKSIGLKAFSFIIILALATLACAVIPSVSSIFNPMPKDDFSSNSSGWGTGTDKDSSVEYANGGLKMVVYKPYFVTWSTKGIEPIENVHVEVNMKNESTDPQALFGIVCDEQGSTQSFYYAGVSSDGYYAIIKSAVAKDDVTLKKGTSNLISAASGSVRIGLDCGGGSLTLYVNGQQIDSVADSTYTSGVIGLFTASDDQNGGATVTFDDYVVTKLGQ